MEHTTIPAGEIHTPYQWIVSDEAARLAIVPEGDHDHHKLCLQLDTHQVWRMDATAPVVWMAAQDAPGTMALHEAAADPHTQYQTEAEGDARYAALVHAHDYEPADATILKDADIGVSVAAQGHSHDLAYQPIGSYAAATHAHAIADVMGLQSALDAKATPSDITSAVNALIDAAPAALDTLNELSAALGDDANFATTVTNALAGKPACSMTLSLQWHRRIVQRRSSGSSPRSFAVIGRH